MEYPRLQVNRPDGTPLSEEQCALLARARKYPQYVKSVENMFAGVCPFCPPDPNYNEIDHELSNEYFWVWPCKPPEDHTEFHYLIVPRRHIESTDEFTDIEDSMAIFAYRSIRRKLGLKTSALLVRDGDATKLAGTIKHLHLHCVVPLGTERVAPPLFKGTESEMIGHARAIIFERVRTSQVKWEDLTEEDHAVINRKSG